MHASCPTRSAGASKIEKTDTGPSIAPCQIKRTVAVGLSSAPNYQLNLCVVDDTTTTEKECHSPNYI